MTLSEIVIERSEYAMGQKFPADLRNDAHTV